MIFTKTRAKGFAVSIFTVAFFMTSLSVAHASATPIASCLDFENINTGLSGSYILTTNLDCSADGNTVMIGSEGVPFTGTFDGGGYQIKVAIDAVGNSVGLFSNTDNATILNLGVTGTIHATGHDVGGIIGTASNTTIQKVFSSVHVRGDLYNVGGIAGAFYNSGSSITNAYFNGVVSAHTDQVGGILGNVVNSGTISNVYSTGTVTMESAGNGVGGIIGGMTVVGGATVLVQNSFSNAYIANTGGDRGAVGGYLYQDITSQITLTNVSYDSNISNADCVGHPYTGVSISCNQATTASLVGTRAAPFSTWDFAGFSDDGTDDIWNLNNGSLPTLSTYLTPPIVTSLSATTGSTAGGEALTINGVYFSNTIGMTVTVDGTNADVVDTGANSQIDIITPAHAAGTVNIIVTNLDGQIALFPFTYIESTPVFAGGQGTVENPYQINSCAGIEAINNNYSKSFVLTQDLDCSSEGNNIIIGDAGENTFYGTLDGKGHTITIAINYLDGHVGLFRSLSGATIKNLHLAGSVTGLGYVGALAGYAGDSKIYYVSSSVTVTSNASNDIAGGLIGRMDGGFIKDSFVTGSVTGVNYVGGLVGQLQNGVIVQRSYADGAVTGSDFVGGFVGSIFASTVTNSFSTGLVTASTRGGFAGLMGGGLDLSSNYFDATTSGTGATCAANGNDACHAVNSDGNNPGFFRNNLASAPAPFNSWDFTHIWIDDFDSAHSPLQNPITAPVGYWKLNENTGAIATDSADGTHNATLQNSPTWTIGNFDHALSFNGSDTYASTTLPWTNSGSISTWVYPTSGAAGASPAGWKLVGANNGYVLIDNGDGTHWRAVFTPDLSGATWAVVEDLDSIVLNQWSHIVMTWSLDAGTYTLHLYVNGVDQGSSTWTGTPGVDGLGGFNIGRSGDFGDGYFAGKIDETKVYDYALDQTVVSTLSNDTPNPASEPVISALATNGEAVDMITQTSARVFGNVTAINPDETYGEYGVVYELDGGDLNDVAPSVSVAAPVFPVATGPFSVTITGLRCGTVYDYQMFLGTEGPRLYAVNTGTFTTLSCGNAAVSVSSGRLLSGAKPFGATPKNPVLFTQNMKLGTVGGEVMSLQKFLNAKSYTVTVSGKETSTFGSKTKKAVQKFQKSHGLKPDGAFGPLTQKIANDILIAEAK